MMMLMFLAPWRLSGGKRFYCYCQKGEVRAALDKLIFDQIEKGKLQAIIARSADF